MRRSGLLALAVAFATISGAAKPAPTTTQPTATSTNAGSTRIIDAGSTRIQIVDGDDRLAGELSKDVDPDTYVVHPSAKPKVVSYITDRGRLDFTVSPGEQYDFAIRHEGRLYNQRIATIDPNAARYRGDAERPGGVDTVPFRLGANNAIHLTGSINGSVPLDLIFDTGAAIGAYNEGSEAKGARLLPGRANSIAFGKVRIDGLALARIDYKGAARTEGVIGFDSFAGKIVQIDYDRQILRIAHDLPDTRGFARVPIVWREMNTMVPMMVGTPEGPKRVLAIFDTGSKFSLSIGNGDAAAAAVRGNGPIGTRTATKVDGTRVQADVTTLPWASIGGLRLANVQADVERAGAPTNLHRNIVGNDFLKRFNVIVDYRSSEIYLKPNHLLGAPYNSVFPMRQALVGLAALIAAATGSAIWWVRRRRRRAAV